MWNILKHLLMGNIMSLLNLQNKPSRNGFDLSEKVAFTAKVGELLPIVNKEVIPGDKFNIKNQWFTRTRPVNTAAYTRIREYYDWFFVPTRLLWKNFLPFITNMRDNSLIAANIYSGISVSEEHPYFTVKQVADYIYSMSATGSTPSGEKKNSFGYERGTLTCKLLNMLGYGWFFDYMENAWGGDSDMINIKLNPFPLLSYQKIYQDFYREQQWQVSQPYTYNLEYMNSTHMNIPIDQMRTASDTMFDLQYCNWNKDLFTGLLPRTQYGAEAVVPLNGAGGIVSFVKTDGIAPATSDVKATLFNGVNRLTLSDGTSVKFNPQEQLSQLSILALRQYEFLQKYKEIAQSGQQDYKHQIEKHFNVKVPDALSEHVTYLGGYATNLDISEVVNTNITGTNDSSIAGKGAGVGNGNIDYEFKEHGILMCIYHAVPLLDYACKGVDKFNQKTMFTDYAIPELDCVGMQSVNLPELSNSYQLGKVIKVNGIDTNALQLGYAARYIDYKTSYDKIRGGFLVSDLQGWCAPITDDYILAYLNNTQQGQGSSIFRSTWFKINPNVLDTIFGVNADSSLETDQLLINSSFDIKAVRNLDVNGLPY